MTADLATLTTALKLLSDPTRLRLCGLLARSELAVQELVTVTGLQQSRVSNHLALLKRSGLVRDRREGTWSFHSLAEPEQGGALSPELYDAVLLPWQSSPDAQRDLQALDAVLEQRRERSRRAHDRLAERWEEGSDFAVGSLRAEVLAQALPARRTVADLGCGTGFLTVRLAATGARVLAVDHSERMLAAARQKQQDEQLAGDVEFLCGELDALPIDDQEVDVAFANLVWHHLPDFESAAAEVFRVLKPGGAVVIADLSPHEAEWMREAMGDLRLGVKADQVIAALARAGFTALRTEAAVDRYRVEGPGNRPHEFAMFLVRGVKPAAGASSETEPNPE